MSVVQVADGYRHYPKFVTPGRAVTINGARLKWYNVAREDAPVPPDVEAKALEFLFAEAASTRWEIDAELGFVLLHRCGEEFYFLILNTWRGSNELWETVYFKSDADVPTFSIFPREHDHKNTYCVWEMGPVWHERNGWVRYLSSARDEPAANIYLDDMFRGPV